MSKVASKPSLVNANEKSLALLVERLTSRLQRGEAVDLSEEVRAHPEHAEQLALLWPALAALADLERSGQARGEAGGPLGELGDFRLEREVGRGGMGIVYEAEQLSLGRRVALKVLPFAATMDPRQLQRFHNEARAAASLHHPNIVPVHAVGQARGVHYYAMQFIDGQTLAALIQSDQPTAPHQPPPAGANRPTAETVAVAGPTERGPREEPYFRRVAAWGIQSAEALEYAHSLGVVHRDIKPGNLMIDAAGTMWVTDFGLARTAADTGLTMTGDLIGTLRYMSPEQALAKHGLVDHRTDVYSLGATLYELLTGVPAVRGQDRQEILRNIAFEEPTQPRRIRNAIPADLETIVLKAIQKEPGKRYATARELAEDLRRFAEHKPILAKPPTIVERMTKWSQRHTALVRAAGVLCVLILLILTGATILLLRAYEKEAGERRRAEENRDFANKVLDDIYVDLVEKRLPTQSAITPEDREILQRALDFYEQLARQNSSNPAGRAKMAEAYGRVGTILINLGQEEQAEEALVRAVANLEALSAESPLPPDAQRCLVACLNNLAICLKDRGRGGAAEEGLLRARALCRELVRHGAAESRFREGVAYASITLGVVLAEAKRNQEAQEAFCEVLDIAAGLARDFPDTPTHLALEANASVNLVNIHLRMGKVQDAEQCSEQALALFQQLTQAHPRDPGHMNGLWSAHRSRGRLFATTGRLPKAEEPFRTAVRTATVMTKEFRNWVGAWEALADSHFQLGHVLKDTNRPDEAEKEYRQSVQTWREMAAQFPRTASHAQGFADSCLFLGHMLRARGLTREAMEQYRAGLEVQTDHLGLQWSLARHLALSEASPAEILEAVELARAATRTSPTDAAIWNTFGLACCRAEDWKAAVDALEKSMALGKGGDTNDWLPLAYAHARLGNLEEARRWYDRLPPGDPPNEALRRFRAAVVKELGIEGPMKTKE
jgi:eukaryotic-like serine/threonine-protein kinase